jgi:hypothetical protein
LLPLAGVMLIMSGGGSGSGVVTGREEGTVRVIWVEFAYEERKTDRETDGDDQCVCESEKFLGHNLNNVSV